MARVWVREEQVWQECRWGRGEFWKSAVGEEWVWEECSWGGVSLGRVELGRSECGESGGGEKRVWQVGEE